MTIAEMLLAEFEQESRTTRKFMERLPEDKLTWKPHQKSYSLGQLALHIANIPGSVAAAASQDSFEFPTTPQPEAKSRQEVLDAFAQSLAAARELLNQMDDSRVMSTWNLTSGGNVVMSIPRIAFIRTILLNHTYHHRGQLSVYLRLLDIPVPAVYGPTADENPFA